MGLLLLGLFCARKLLVRQRRVSPHPALKCCGRLPRSEPKGFGQAGWFRVSFPLKFSVPWLADRNRAEILIIP